MTIEQIRNRIRDNYLADETEVLSQLMAQATLTEDDRKQISLNAAELVRRVRAESSPSMMENFLAEYGLTTKEGVALMCLAEALLRVPDSITIDALIEDKVAGGEWHAHLGGSASSMVNSSTWALMLTGKLIAPNDEKQKNITQSLHSMVKRLGEPVVRVAVGQAMKELGRQFVLGRNIEEATKRAKKLEARGYTYSYDMLGEAARTDADALRYHKAYADAIAALAPRCVHAEIRKNPGISVKLSALHPRYEFGKKARVMEELVSRTLSLVVQAKEANMGFNIDAEEADRLDLSLDVIAAVLKDPRLAGWDGFGVVVQAFGQRTAGVIDWLYTLATNLDRRIMVRLVKGAYWDAEIKRAQVLGLDGFPVYTRKIHSDVSYICCAEKLLGMTDRIYPQFATHNAHSVSAVLQMAKGLTPDAYEFQRLHGMGEALHDKVLTAEGTGCRIYAPVGAHQDLLAYLVRRLLENGANSSFVNQIVDTRIKPEEIARDPFDIVEAMGGPIASKRIVRSADLYGAGRRNAIGWDITDSRTLEKLNTKRYAFQTARWVAEPMMAKPAEKGEAHKVLNPARPTDVVGNLTYASQADVQLAVESAKEGFKRWSATPAAERAACLNRVADLYEEHAAELFALASREAGKTLLDAVGEIREAVDFARYYAVEAEKQQSFGEARGVISCISPWNFPLAIFSGQLFAALAAGNAVLAKPADQTNLIAARAVELIYEAGIPRDVVQLLPGSGVVVGAAMTSHPDIAGVCFTGSTLTAQRINRVMADNMAADTPLIAETGGLNAMIVDSTALPEQVVRDVLASAFQSAGQRCSALRMLYVQEDIAEHLLEMLCGAMDELKLGNPWQLDTDIGPVIDEAAKAKIDAHCKAFEVKGRLIKQLATPKSGLFVGPAVIRVNGIEELEEEIFGPVLHLATFKADQLLDVVDAINAKGFGLTFGLHTRMDTRVEQVTQRIKVGNIYVNRNQIGAIVGSQPFGGEGLSGTGPKAGGPEYVKRFRTLERLEIPIPEHCPLVTANALQSAIDQLTETQHKVTPEYLAKLGQLLKPLGIDLASLQTDAELMPGPTGELNRLARYARGVVICAGPDTNTAITQAAVALSQGNSVVVIAAEAQQQIDSLGLDRSLAVAINGVLDAEALKSTQGFHAITSVAETAQLKRFRQALAQREGVLIPLITEYTQPERFVVERHLCIDTTAAGGNASLIAAAE